MTHPKAIGSGRRVDLYYLCHLPDGGQVRELLHSLFYTLLRITS